VDAASKLNTKQKRKQNTNVEALMELETNIPNRNTDGTEQNRNVDTR
jgi:hypothetical protein